VPTWLVVGVVAVTVMTSGVCSSYSEALAASQCNPLVVVSFGVCVLLVL
jgi:hypothetical protein